MKSYTDIEQSKKLAEILPLESADMNYWCGTQIKIGGHRTMDKDLDIPCWSLAALLSVLPFQFIVNNQRYGFGINKGFNKDGETYAIKYATFYTTDYLHLTDYYNNPIDACVEMICWLKENDKL